MKNIYWRQKKFKYSSFTYIYMIKYEVNSIIIKWQKLLSNSKKKKKIKIV